MDDYEALFDCLTDERSRELGINLEEALSPIDLKPSFSIAYAKRARELNTSALALFEKDAARMQELQYPGPECILPSEFDEFSRSGELAEGERRHIEVCGICRAVLDAMKVSQRKLDDFLQVVREERQSPSDFARRVTTELERLRSEAPGRDRASAQFQADPAPLLAEDAMNVIGGALKRIAETLDCDPHRRPNFRALLEHVRCKYPGRTSWDFDLLLQADALAWPSWATECLPNLYIPLSEDGRNALVWHYMIACVPRDHKFDRLDRLCDGVVLEVQVDEVAALLLRSLAELFEQNRLGNPHSTNQSMRTVAQESLLHSIEQAQKQGDFATAESLEHALRDIQTAVLPDYDEVVNALELLAQAREPHDRQRIPIEPLKSLYPDALKELRETATRRGLREIADSLTGTYRSEE